MGCEICDGCVGALIVNSVVGATFDFNFVVGLSSTVITIGGLAWCVSCVRYEWGAASAMIGAKFVVGASAVVGGIRVLGLLASCWCGAS